MAVYCHFITPCYAIQDKFIDRCIHLGRSRKLNLIQDIFLGAFNIIGHSACYFDIVSCLKK